MMLPLFAFLDDAKQSIMQFVHNCLLVAGAFLVGYILGGLIGWALGKWALEARVAANAQADGPPGRGPHPRVHRRAARLQRHGQALGPRRRRRGDAERHRQQGAHRPEQSIPIRA